MYANKTTRLVEELNTLDTLDKQVLFINYLGHDDRKTAVNDGYLSSHNAHCKLSENIAKHVTSSLNGINVDAYDVIGIDEGQFFDDLYDTVRSWVIDHSKIVIVVSLDADSDMRPFGQAHDLECICMQSNIIRLSAFCAHCVKQGKLIPASFTKCLVKKTSQSMIADDQYYQAVCFDCF